MYLIVINTFPPKIFKTADFFFGFIFEVIFPQEKEFLVILLSLHGPESHKEWSSSLPSQFPVKNSAKIYSLYELARFRKHNPWLSA